MSSIRKPLSLTLFGIILGALAILGITNLTENTYAGARWVTPSASSPLSAAPAAPAAPTTPATLTAPSAPTKPIAPDSAFNAPNAGATTPSTTPPATKTTPPKTGLSTTMTWHKQCPKGYGFCANFPYYGDNFKTKQAKSATARSGRLNSFESTTHLTAGGKFCATKADKAKCAPSVAGGHAETYFVKVIVTKHRDPYKAITAINGGLDNPDLTRSLQGHPTARFTHGLYGGPGMAVYNNGKVYYLEADIHTDENKAKAKFIDQFLASFQLT